MLAVSSGDEWVIVSASIEGVCWIHGSESEPGGMTGEYGDLTPESSPSQDHPQRITSLVLLWFSYTLKIYIISGLSSGCAGSAISGRKDNNTYSASKLALVNPNCGSS